MQTIKTLIKSSGDIYSSYLPFMVDTLNNTSNYEMDLQVETQSGTGEGITVDLVKDFNVQYQPLSLTFKPILTEVVEKSGVKLDWSLLSQYPGVISGTSNYIDRYLYNTNTGLNLTEGSSLSYSTATLPANFTLSFMQQLPLDFDGVIFQTIDGKYELGYHNILGINDTNLTYEGTWTVDNNVGYHNGIAKYSTIADNNFTMGFNGTSIKAHFIQSIHMGKVEVFIDNNSQGIIDLYKGEKNTTTKITQISDGISTVESYIYKSWNEISSDVLNDISTFSWNNLTHQTLCLIVDNLLQGDHVIKVNVVGDKNTLFDSNEVEFEYFELLNAQNDNMFYTTIQGITINSEPIKITTNPFAFICFPDHVLIKQYNTYNLGIPNQGVTTNPGTGEIIDPGTGEVIDPGNNGGQIIPPIDPDNPIIGTYNLWGEMISKTWNELKDFTWEFLNQTNK